MSHPHSALHIYQFISSLHQSLPEDLFESILLSLRTPRFAPVSSITERWSPILHAQAPSALSRDFDQLMASAARSPDYDALLIKVADHYPLIDQVSCFLENDLELELFVRCLCLDSSTPVSKEEVKQTLKQFLAELTPQQDDARAFIQEILVRDKHEYLSPNDMSHNRMVDDSSPMDDGFLDLDKVYNMMQDPDMFDQFMAIIQSNTSRGVIWSQTVQEIYELVASKGIWEQLAPLLQQVYAKTGKKKKKQIL